MPPQMTYNITPDPYYEPVNLARNDLGYDAWGRPKTIQDFSILHGMWTFNVPDTLWRSCYNDVEYASNTDNPYISSVDGMLRVTSGTNAVSACGIRSKRHPRYQPNRGHLYSTSIIVDTPDTGIKDWGLFTDENGVLFRQKDGKLYAVIRSLGVETHEEEIDLPNTVDLTKGNVYDIQFQWRGVGSYFFYVNLEKVHTIQVLGTLGNASISNPALPLTFRSTSTETGVDSVFRVGCVDVTSEGGKIEGSTYQAVTTGETLLSVNNDVSFGQAILAIRIKPTIDGKYNTLDNELLRISTFCKDEANTLVFLTRNINIIGNIAENSDPLVGWADLDGTGVQFMRGGHLTTLETTFTANKDNTVKQIGFSRAEIDFKNEIDNPGHDKTSFYLTNGDYLILCVDPDGDAKSVAGSIELGIEI